MSSSGVTLGISTILQADPMPSSNWIIQNEIHGACVLFFNGHFVLLLAFFGNLFVLAVIF